MQHRDSTSIEVELNMNKFISSEGNLDVLMNNLELAVLFITPGSGSDKNRIKQLNNHKFIDISLVYINNCIYK